MSTPSCSSQPEKTSESAAGRKQRKLPETYGQGKVAPETTNRVVQVSMQGKYQARWFSYRESTFNDEGCVNGSSWQAV